MRFGERAIVKTLAWGIRKAGPGQLAEIRAAFDERYADRDEEWRRDMWAAAAEHVSRKTSKDAPGA